MIKFAGKCLYANALNWFDNVNIDETDLRSNALIEWLDLNHGIPNQFGNKTLFLAMKKQASFIEEVCINNHTNKVSFVKGVKHYLEMLIFGLKFLEIKDKHSQFKQVTRHDTIYATSLEYLIDLLCICFNLIRGSKEMAQLFIKHLLEPRVMKILQLLLINQNNDVTTIAACKLLSLITMTQLQLESASHSNIKMIWEILQQLIERVNSYFVKHESAFPSNLNEFALLFDAANIKQIGILKGCLKGKLILQR